MTEIPRCFSDAGKTTLTEKFLLYGGAIQLAGSVKGKKTARHAVSDWMEIEKQRGISVTSAIAVAAQVIPCEEGAVRLALVEKVFQLLQIDPRCSHVWLMGFEHRKDSIPVGGDVERREDRCTRLLLFSGQAGMEQIKPLLLGTT